jgi:ribokinase
VLLTRGSRGALLAQGSERIEVEPWPVDVVDSTGAGDAFSGTLAAALDAGMALPDAAHRAAAAGALACTALGVVPSLASRDRLEEFMEKSG